MGIDLILKAREKGIHILCLPPHTTHILQPLDIGDYGPVKTTWRKLLRQYRVQTRASEITKESLPGKHCWHAYKCIINPHYIRLIWTSLILLI